VAGLAEFQEVIRPSSVCHLAKDPPKTMEYRPQATAVVGSKPHRCLTLMNGLRPATKNKSLPCLVTSVDVREVGRCNGKALGSGHRYERPEAYVLEHRRKVWRLWWHEI
jgi:hypothetical protein